jgi:predicted ATPase
MHLGRARVAAEPDALPSARPAWTVRLLGAVEADNGEVVISSFPTRAVAQLLALLALYPGRAHAREELVDLIWPGVALSTGRNRLRQALSALKALLERHDGAHRQVIRADRMAVRAVPGSLDCDVRLFEQLLTSGHPDSARALHRGAFMPGHYEEWVLEERRRVEALQERLQPRSLATPSLPLLPAAIGVPNYWTPAFGLQARIDDLATVVIGHRLVNVLGAGGTGKTRLAASLARALAQPPSGRPSAFDGIVFVSLIDCVAAARVLPAVCDALGLGAVAHADRALNDALAGRRVLLVLDNCEQLEPAAADVLARLLTGLPQLHLLITSRRILNVEGERRFELKGLASCEPGQSSGPSPGDAVALFIDRAGAVRPGYAPASAERADIAGLVNALHGMPLAIELAASRVRSLAPGELLRRLTAGTGSPALDLLSRHPGSDDGARRHASIRQVMAWSWSMLSAADATLMQCLAALGGSARAETVAAVAGLDTAAAEAALERLEGASLVVQDRRGAVARHRLLQPVREFAAEQTETSAARAMRGRLRRWLLACCTGAGAWEPAALREEAQLIVTAMATAAADGAQADAVELALALRPYWDVEIMPEPALQALAAALPTMASDAMRAEVHALMSFGFGQTGHFQLGLEHAEAALALTADEQVRVEAFSSATAMRQMYDVHDPRVESDAIRAEAQARALGHARALAIILRTRAVHACNVRLDYARAEQFLAEAQRLWEALGSRRMANARRMERAVMQGHGGTACPALTLIDECERAAVDMQDWLSAITASWQRGRLLLMGRRFEAAAEAFRHCVRMAWQRQFAHLLPKAVLHLPEALAMLGQAETAARLQGYAIGRQERAHGPINRIEARELKRGRRMIRLQLGALRAETLRLEGLELTHAQAMALALAEPAQRHPPPVTEGPAPGAG